MEKETVRAGGRVLHRHVDELVRSGAISEAHASELHSTVNEVTTAIQNHYDSL